MKILVVNTDYPEFLEFFYERNPGLKQEPYDIQMKARMATLFGGADFYSDNLCQLGHEAWDIHTNNEIMQKTWALERGIKIFPDLEWKLARRRKTIPWMERRRSTRWMYQILIEQIKYYKPDVLLNQAMDVIPSSFFKEMKPWIRLLVGQHAATPLSESEDFSAYDLCLSSFPPMVDYFRSRGLRAELQRLAFEPRILQVLNESSKAIDISFIGSLHPIHNSRTEWLEQLCRQFSVKVWTPNLANLAANSNIRRSYAGSAWGSEMFQIIHDSRITLNHHGNIPPYANNYRLYEATGTGALLMTDWKENLHEIFSVDKEVVAYRSTEECVELIQYYLNHPDEAEAIAHAGQQRTLHDHTYGKRMEEFVEIVRQAL